MTAEVERRRSGSGRPEVIPSGPRSGRARHAQARHEHRMILRGVELDALVHALRDRRVQQNLITGIIGLAALVGIAREGRTRMLTHVLTWDKRQGRRDRTAAARRRRRR
jgi:hypothetical protein